MNSMTIQDEQWMRRVLRLATRGLGHASPNPSVAAIIVKDGEELGRGVHMRCGGDHGEICALKDAAEKALDVRGATMYVSLAPCTKQGRTPACAQALVKAGVRRVVAACPDPFQDDAADLFKQHAITYDVGCLQSIAQHVHGGFLKRMQTGLPRITGKWAMTLDGSIATENGHSQWISSTQALGVSRRRRRVFDAIVVGARTFELDDPQLLASAQVSPKRIILAQSHVPSFSGKPILPASEQCPIYCFYQQASAADIQSAQDNGIQMLHYDDLTDVFVQLAQLGCNEVLVEGGSQIHQACLDKALYDRLEVYVGARTIAGGLSVAGNSGKQTIDLGQSWQLETSLRLGDTYCLRYQRS